MAKRVLIIDDDIPARTRLEHIVTAQGYRAISAGDGSSGVRFWCTEKPHVVLADLKMPLAGELDVLDFRNSYFQEVPVVILTGCTTIPSAVMAMKKGAHDYLTKPVNRSHLLEVLSKVCRAKERKHTSGKSHCSSVTPMVGTSAAMQTILQDIDLVGTTELSVLILGESGTGKELVARAIHDRSENPGGPFIRVNCAAIPRELLESELFGHVRGAFTGAIDSHVGAFVRADGGSLFLDEVGDLPLELQPKLLHAVEEKMVTPVGAVKTSRVRVKIIAATNLDLKKMVENGKFRSDLYYRLNRYPVHVPPLRRRGNDVRLLVDYYTDRLCKEYKRSPLRLTEDLYRMMGEYSWPGNVRELRNVVERLVISSKNGNACLEKLNWQQNATGDYGEVKHDDFHLERREKQLIVKALDRCGWNKSASARKLGITRNALRYRIQKYEISRMA